MKLYGSENTYGFGTTGKYKFRRENDGISRLCFLDRRVAYDRNLVNICGRRGNPDILDSLWLAFMFWCGLSISTCQLLEWVLWRSPQSYHDWQLLPTITPPQWYLLKNWSYQQLTYDSPSDQNWNSVTSTNATNTWNQGPPKKQMRFAPHNNMHMLYDRRHTRPETTRSANHTNLQRPSPNQFQKTHVTRRSKN